MKVYHILNHSVDVFHPELKENVENFKHYTSNISRFVDNLMKYDTKKEFDHTIVYLSGSVNQERTYMKHNDGYDLLILKNSIHLPFFFPCEWSFPLIKFIKETNDAILHVHGSSSFIFDSIAPSLSKKPSCAHYRGGEFTWRSFPISFPKYYLFAPFTMKAPKYWFMQNKVKLNKYSEWYNIPKEHLIHMPNGIEIEKFKRNEAAVTRAREQMGANKDTKIILFVGRIVRNKGIRELVSSFATIRKKHPNTILALLGTGPMEKDIKGKPGVFSPGRINDFNKLIPFYHASDIFALPTYYDSSPNTLVEAMACGLPCISTPADGPKDMIEHKKDGIFVPIGDARALHDSLLLLLEDDSLRNKLGKAAKEKVLRDFLWKKNVSKVYEVYRKLGQEFRL